MEQLIFDSLRRFGVELEINAFDMRSKPIGYDEGKLPEGIHYVANLVKTVSEQKVVIHRWSHDHHNNCWIIKPDGSCGMEICTPVMKGWHGLKQTCKVVDALKDDKKIAADSRCSLHLHVDVSDLSDELVAAIILWWIKFEPVFMDAMPMSRKINQYCQFIGLTDLFEVEDKLASPKELFKKLGISKYYSINTFHYFNQKRKTLEFRIMDSRCCLDSWMTKNWIRLILHFVDTVVKNGMPIEYQPGNKWSGYCWLDPIDLFQFLKFNSSDISVGLQQVRRWFLGRLLSEGRNLLSEGIISDKSRQISISQVDELIYGLSLDKDEIFEHTSSDVYGDEFRF